MYRFYCDCVSWPGNDVRTEGGLSDLINDRVEITRKTFLQYANRDDLQQLEEGLSYSRHPKQGLTMAGDQYVEYFRSKLHGKRVYGFRHSAIEYVFTLEESQASSEEPYSPPRTPGVHSAPAGTRLLAGL